MVFIGFLNYVAKTKHIINLLILDSLPQSAFNQLNSRFFIRLKK